MALYQALRDADDLVSKAAHSLKRLNHAATRIVAKSKVSCVEAQTAAVEERTARGECEGSRACGRL
jgi:hypothetical protein